MEKGELSGPRRTPAVVWGLVQQNAVNQGDFQGLPRPSFTTNLEFQRSTLVGWRPYRKVSPLLSVRPNEMSDLHYPLQTQRPVGGRPKSRPRVRGTVTGQTSKIHFCTRLMISNWHPFQSKRVHLEFTLLCLPVMRRIPHLGASDSVNCPLPRANCVNASR